MKEEVYLIVGCAESGIFIYRFNTQNGESVLLNDVLEIKNPIFQTFSKDEKFLYSVAGGVGENARAYAYSFDGKTGEVRLLNSQAAGGDVPCSIWTDRQRKVVITADYSGGTMSIFPVLSNGTLDKATIYKFEGGTHGSARQNAPHPHCVYCSPDEKYLFINDLGTDRIYKFELSFLYENGNARVLPFNGYFTLPNGEGPRHSVFHQNGKYAYVLGELSGRVTVLQYENGDFKILQHIEADSVHAAGSADIRISPDGHFLYASNRLKNDGIAVFAIDDATGLLTSIGYVPTGKHPRNFTIAPGGKFLLCACRDDNVIQIFELNNKTGLLSATDKKINVEKPVCLSYASVY